MMQLKTSKNGSNRSPLLKILHNKKEEVEKMLYSLKEKQREGLNQYDSVEELDRAEKEISVKTYFNLLGRKNNELKKIEELIQRALNNSDFGYCEECGEKINPKRLMVIPEATLCIDCQQEMENLGMTISPTGSYKSSKWQIESEDYDVDDVVIIGNKILKQEMADLSLAEMEEFDIIDGQSEEDEDDEDDEDNEPEIER